MQAQILRLLATLQRDLGLGLLLITHDLGIVARVADRVSVMYAGEVVESAPTAELFANPRHPYTQGLLRCVPVPGKIRRDEPLGSIPGTVPRVGPGFEGCAFRERCDFADETCKHTIPRHHAARPTTSSAGCPHDRDDRSATSRKTFKAGKRRRSWRSTTSPSACRSAACWASWANRAAASPPWRA